MKETANQLQSAVSRYSALLKNVTENESNKPLGKEKWSRKQILGHLIDSASNNHQRFIHAQVQSHVEMPGYTQNEWVDANGYNQESWQNLVQLWTSYNTHLAHVIARLPESALSNTISLNGEPSKTLQFVADDYVRHLVHHLKQLQLE